MSRSVISSVDTQTSFRKSYVNTNRWFITLINQKQVKAVIGDFKLCEKAGEFDPKKYAEFQAAVSFFVCFFRMAGILWSSFYGLQY